MSKKIKVLVVPSDRTGVGYFRSTKPHITLENNYPDEFHVDIDYEPRIDDDNFLKKYDIIHYHRTFGQYEKCAELVNRCNDLGIVTIMDIDDHWAPGKHHPAYLMIKQAEMDKKILENIKSAKNITTTTTLFADEIAKYNKTNNIYILPNAIDPKEKQYTPKPTKSDRLRIGWLGGSSHLKDLEILEGVVSKLKSDGLMDKVQFVVCGFDLRGSVTMIDEKTGQQKQRPIQPMESVWYLYEKIFTNNYQSVSEDYKNFLHKFKKGEYEGIENEPYRRVWTKPISTYATNYNLFDVSLAPVKEHVFNYCKSQLKVIEAGFHKKALIASDFGPYQIDLVDAYERGGTFNDKGNAFLVGKHKNHKDWSKRLELLYNNPDLVTQLGENLYQSVQKYHIDNVTKNRSEFYKTLVENKEIEVKNLIEEINEI